MGFILLLLQTKQDSSAKIPENRYHIYGIHGILKKALI